MVNTKKDVNTDSKSVSQKKNEDNSNGIATQNKKENINSKNSSAQNKNSESSWKEKYFPIFKFTIAVIIVSIILVIIVMQLIGGVGPGTGQKPMAIDVLSNAVKSANPSGEKRVTNFVLRKNASIDNSDLTMRTDFDEGSFVFFTNDALPDVESGDGTYFKYKGVQQELTLSAVVICKPTGDQLCKAVTRWGENNDIYTDFSGEQPDDCDFELCENGLVCCAIIPLKRN